MNGGGKTSSPKFSTRPFAIARASLPISPTRTARARSA
jgi:hypothetical protein